MVGRSVSLRGSPTILTALVFVLGMEMARFQFASLGWYQRDTLLVSTLDLIPLALAPFLAGALLPIASRFLTLRASLLVGVALLIVARLVNQVTSNPAIDHWASAAALAAFVGLLPIAAGLGRSALVGGVLMGIVLDSAIKILGATLDLAYRPGVLPLLAVIALAAAAVFLAVTVEVGERTGPTWGGGYTLIGLGPYLFVQYLVLQSPGWTAEATSFATDVSGLRIVVLNLVGLWLAYRFGGSRLLGAVAGVVVGAAVVLADGPSLAFDLLALAAVPAAGLLWAALVPDSRGLSLAPAATYLTTGMVLFLLLGLAYYLPLDLDLGFTQTQALLAGAALATVLAVLAAARRWVPTGAAVETGIPQLALVTLALPVAALVGGSSLPEPPQEEPVRVMAYNIHQAFGTAGGMDVDAVARVILDSGATVVGLQEVARGGLLNAGTDLVTLLGRRLGWEHIAFIGTTDPVWGNAILSRYPLGEVEKRLLPTAGTLYRRGYLAAPVEVPGGELLFISTHLQHINDPDLHDIDPESDLYPVHHEQLSAVIEEWDGRSPAVLVGDLNARPGWRQVEELLDAGWVDAWAEAGSGDGFTSNAAQPEHRIDYVFHTPDLTTVAVEVVESQASDHFAVVADLRR